MSLKQIKPVNRITFLRMFVAETLISLEGPRISEKIRIEKLKQKFLEPIDSKKTLKESISTSFFQEPIYSKEIERDEFEIDKLREQERIREKEKRILFERKPLLHKARIFKRPPKKQLIRPIIFGRKRLSAPRVQKIKPKIQPQISPQTQALAQIKPEAQPRPKGFGLGVLEPLLKDVSIQSIECPGPNKNILVKKYSKVNVTKIILSQKDITNIINNFSIKAKIPIVGGILKAAVGDLVVSAVISEFIGSRFIINKIIPHSKTQK